LEPETSDPIAEIPFAPGLTSAAQSASPGNGAGLGGDRLAMGASLVYFTVQWPEWADSPEAIAARHPIALDVDRVQALVTYRMNATSQAGAFKAVGIDANVGGEMIREDRGLRRVLSWAAGLAEVRIASNMLRLATGVGPQAAQAATLIAERQLGWNKENVLRIEGDIDHHLDVKHTLSDERLIELENEAEARRQQIEEGIIDAEFRELPPHDEVPPLPDVEFDQSAPNPTRVKDSLRSPVEDSTRAPVSKQGRAQGGDFRPTQHRKVDGIETEFSDETGSSSSDSGGIRIVG